MKRCRSNKRYYRTELDARIVLSNRRVRDKGASRTYSCPMCGGYHITSQTQRTGDFNPPQVDSINAN